MKHHGSCHCGRVAFEVEGEPERLIACNCSICARRGSLLWFVGPQAFRLLTPEQNAATYTFNRQVIRHRHCPVCGCAPYAEGTAPSGEAVVAINARCLEDLDLTGLPVTEFDGKRL